MVEQYYGFSPAFCISHKCLSLGKSSWVPCWQKFYKCNSQPSMPFDVWESMGNGIEPNWQQIIQHNILLQEGGPLSGPESWLLSNSLKWIIQGGTYADKARDFVGEGCPGEDRRVRKPRGTVFCHVAPSLRSYAMGLVSELSLASHSDSGSFWVAHAWLSQDAFQWGGFWEVGRTDGLESPFDFSKFFQLMVAC